ncbi:MAG: hypothetical protein HUU46_12905 [Candidatus Hydrogenedentes bacterium]|nr:hypothetical protein [Candidatus Hydrogenedentota bacterium]
MADEHTERQEVKQRGGVAAIGIVAGLLFALVGVAAIIITRDLPGSNALTLIAGWLIAPLMIVLEVFGLSDHPVLLVPVAMLSLPVLFAPTIVRVVWGRPRKRWVMVAVQVALLTAYILFGALMTVTGR